MINPDRISESLETNSWVKILKLFDGDQGWKIFGSGMENSRIGINIQGPGSTYRISNTEKTSKKCTYCIYESKILQQSGLNTNKNVNTGNLSTELRIRDFLYGSGSTLLVTNPDHGWLSSNVGDPADPAQKHADPADLAPDPDPQHCFQDANIK
jgi:hypothetical protein